MEKSGYHLSKSYPKMLAAFGAWATFGIAFILLGTGQYLFGGILAFFGVGMVVLAIRGGRNSQRAYTRVDLVIQWITLVIPIVLAVLLFFLAFAFFRPYAVYVALYLAVLIFLAALAGRELRRRVPADQPQ